MMDSNKLKPCPFCGSPAELEYKHKDFPDGDNWLHIVCTECGESTGWYLNAESAREAWNRRSENES